MGELSYGIMFGDKRERHGGHDLNIEATDCVHKTYTWVSYHMVLCLVINRKHHGGLDSTIESTDCVHKTYTWVSYGDPIFIFYSLFCLCFGKGISLMMLILEKNDMRVDWDFILTLQNKLLSIALINFEVDVIKTTGNKCY